MNANNNSFKSVAVTAAALSLFAIAAPVQAQGFASFNNYVPSVIHNYDTMQPFMNANIAESARRLEQARAAKRAEKEAAKQLKQKERGEKNEQVAVRHHWFKRSADPVQQESAEITISNTSDANHTNQLAADGPARAE